MPVNPNISDVVGVETRISFFDSNDCLILAGRSAEQLIKKKYRYEDVLFLLLKNDLPTVDERRTLIKALAEPERNVLSPALEAMIDALPKDLDYLDVLIMGISALASSMTVSYPPTDAQALDCLAKIPLILSRYLHGAASPKPDATRSYVENYFYLMTRRWPQRTETLALEADFIRNMEQGVDTAAYASRVSTSTESDLVSSVAAGVCALKGSLTDQALRESATILPETLHRATRAIAQCAGFVAHIHEQAQKNRLIRPESTYTGAWPADIAEQMQQESLMPQLEKPVLDPTILNQGLEGVIATTTTIASVDGEHNRLVIAGHNFSDLIHKHNCSYEDVLFLLLRRKLPTAEERADFSKELIQRRTQGWSDIATILEHIPHNLSYMEAFRTGISVLAFNVQSMSNEERVLECIAKAPLILSSIYRLKNNQPILTSNPEWSHVENFFYLLTDKDPTLAVNTPYVEAFEAYCKAMIEHTINASTYQARICASNGADVISSFVAALSTLKGDLHGGALPKVIDMFKKVNERPEETLEKKAEAFILNELHERRRVYGLGHRVYNKDPRVDVLEAVGDRLPNDGNEHYAKLSRVVKAAAVDILQKKKSSKPLHPNVDYSAALILFRALNGLSTDLFICIFGLARLGGYGAHYLEQADHNISICPASRYIGNPLQNLSEKVTKLSTNIHQFWEFPNDSIESSTANACQTAEDAIEKAASNIFDRTNGPV